MAKRKVNKSAKIREYAEANPSEGPTAIATALKGQGIKVTPQQVSTTLTNARKKAGKSRRGRKPKVSAPKVSVDQILQAKKLADQMGGVAKAKAALDALSKIVD